jgi:hypothetical protein
VRDAPFDDHARLVEDFASTHEDPLSVPLINDSCDLEIACGKREVMVVFDSESKVRIGLSLDVLGDGGRRGGTFIDVVVLVEWLVINEDLDIESGARRRNHHDAVGLFVVIGYTSVCMRRSETCDGNGPFIYLRAARSQLQAVRDTGVKSMK